DAAHLIAWTRREVPSGAAAGRREGAA
ncbi:M48 family peptidase, partial [Clavibacter michiganensis]